MNRMLKDFAVSGAIASAVLFAILAHASATVGDAAPAFTLTDTAGKAVKLADYKGKYVVLEWTNPECPYVQKHYNSRNMQGLQKEYTPKNVVWLTINSTKLGHSEYKAPAVMASWETQMGAAPSATLLDPDGAVGKSYGARTTPHMYIVDPRGQLVYAGAIDSIRSSDPGDIRTAKNYVRVAMNESLAGKPISTPTSTPYGCSIKY